jgi:hypothetical protein
MIVSTQVKGRKIEEARKNTVSERHSKENPVSAGFQIWLSSSVPKPLDKAALALNLQPRCCIGTIVLTQYFASEVSRIETKLKSLFSLLGLFRN